MNMTWFVSALFFSFLVTGASVNIRGQEGPKSQDVSITYELPEQKVSLHEPIILVFKVKNGTEDAIHLDLGEDRKGGFQFGLTTPDGRKISLALPMREGPSRVGSFDIRTGESYSEKLVINEWYNIKAPGRYELEGHLIQPIVGVHSALSKKDGGFRAVLEITPRDELALTKACDTLSNQIDASNSYQDAADAAFALTYAEDPACVPFLRRALFSQKLVEPLAINGLEKIANEAAIRVLIEALRMKTADYAALARASLVRIQSETAGTALKEEINQALKDGA